ncbi:MAG TPA: hypothetical protein VNX47_12280 [Nevskia sp.]|jgi:hypothetical protein|nr:hypothetical protein [Nevskia sp.]
MNKHIVPLLFGFLLLGGASHATPTHRHANNAPTATPAQQPAPMPRQLRTRAEGAAAASRIEPLPVYVPESGESCDSGCSWST